MATWKDEQSRRDKHGKRWNFCFWWEVWTENKVIHAQRLFFWDDRKMYSGVVLFPPGSAMRAALVSY